MGKKTPLPVLKVVVIGSTGVGKYSLSQQYARGWVTSKTDNPNPLEVGKAVQLQGRKYDAKLIICKDVENEQAALNGVDGAALVYSVTDKSSFTFLKNTAFQKLHEALGHGSGENAEQKAAQQQASKQSGDGNATDVAETPTGQPADLGLKVPVVLIGNKVDDAKLAREIEPEDGEALAKELRCLGFFETAAPCNANVPKAFDTLLNEIAEKKTADGSVKAAKATNACCVLL